MSYCIAFSNEGATDVTRRYMRNTARFGANRTRAPEEVLLWIMNDIKRQRRENLSKEERRRLIREDDREEKELRGYVCQALAAEVIKMAPGGTASNGGSSSSGDDTKLPAGRQSGSAEWVRARGEGGMGRPGPDQSRDQH